MKLIRSKTKFASSLGIFAFAAGYLIVALCANPDKALAVATGTPGLNPGAIAADAFSNLGIGTTPSSSVKFLIQAPNALSSNYAFSVIKQNGSTIIQAGNDGTVSIPGLVGAGANAANISAGPFGANVGNGNFSFPASVGIGTSTPSFNLDIFGPGSANSFVGIQAKDSFTNGTNQPPLQLGVLRDSTNAYSLPGIWLTGGTPTFSNVNFIYDATNLIFNAPSGKNISFRINNGSSAIFVSSSSNVGIGTAAPAVSLETNGIVRSDRLGSPPQYVQINGGDSSFLYITGQSNATNEKALLIQNLGSVGDTLGVGNNIYFDNGIAGSAVHRMVIDYLGKVGIGTNTPTSTLTVAGEIKTTSGGVRFPDGSLQTTASGGAGSWTATSSGIFYNGGSVGIGTTSPVSPLDVIGLSNTTGTLRLTAPNVTDAPWIDFNVAGVGVFGQITNSAGFRFKSSQDVSMIPGASGAFRVNNPAAPTTSFFTVLGSNGNVGIGTSTPAAKLDVAGAINLMADGTHDAPLQVGYTAAAPAGYYAVYAP
jgi:hypothetical protein